MAHRRLFLTALAALGLPAVVLAEPERPVKTSAAAPAPTVTKGRKRSSSKDATAQRTTVVPANAGRISVVIQNLGAATVYLGDSGVSRGNGIEVPPGGTVEDGDSVDAWHGVTESGTAELHILEIVP